VVHSGRQRWSHPRPGRTCALQLFVSQPYLELHTARDAAIGDSGSRPRRIDRCAVRRTDWFKVRTERGVEGWARHANLPRPTWPMARRSRWTLAIVPAFRHTTGRAGFMPVPTPARPCSAPGVHCRSRQSQAGARDVTVHRKRLRRYIATSAWRTCSCRVALLAAGRSGTGVVWSSPRPRWPRLWIVPIRWLRRVGGRLYLTRRFFMRGEYRQYVVFTRTNANEVNGNGDSDSPSSTEHCARRLQRLRVDAWPWHHRRRRRRRLGRQLDADAPRRR